jgi:hypothetical protein
MPQEHPISTDAINRMWPLFSSDVRDKLVLGADLYGDGSFSFPIDQLLKEISEELIDISGWSFILWTRIQNLRQELRDSEYAKK